MKAWAIKKGRQYYQGFNCWGSLRTAELFYRKDAEKNKEKGEKVVPVEIHEVKDK